MKALTLTLVALVLGVGLFLWLAGPDGRERSPRGAPAAPTEADRAPVAPSPPAGHEPKSAAAQPESLGRSSVAATPVPEARLVYEGTLVADGGPVPGADVQILRREEALGGTQVDERGHFRLTVAPAREALRLVVRGRGFVPLERTLPPRPNAGTEQLGAIRLVRGQLFAGRVVDPLGNGIADAELSAQPVNPGTDLLCARARSGPDGRFEIPDSPSGPLLVTARAKGFGERAVPFTPGPASGVLEIRLQAGLDLAIRLRTPRGAPVAGAEVTIQPPNNARASAHTGTSDGEGRVRFEGLSERQWNARVAHPDFRTPARAEVQAGGGEQTLECAPWPAIEGVVLTPAGTPPPAGTKVHALPAAAPGDRMTKLVGGHDVGPDGHFRIGGLRPGDWRVHAVAPGFAPATSAPVKLGVDGDGYTGTITLAPAARLVLELTSQGRPAAGAEVEVFPTAPRAALLWSLSSRGAEPRPRSGSDGRVVLGDLVPGPVWVAILFEGCPPTSAGPFDVGSEEARPIAIDLPRGARVRGRVLAPGGRPYADAQLRLTDPAGNLGFPLMLASGEDGSYTSAWLPAGHYRIEAFVPADPALRSGAKELDLEPGEQRELDLDL